MNVLPMTIEAENFDFFAISGEGRVYNDTGSGNTGGDYRTDENVDIQEASEGGYNIGWIEAGEYLTYTVYVPEDGNYDISIKYAATSANGKIKVSFDGIDETGEVSLPNTGNWQVYEDIALAQGVSLMKGVKSMRVDMISSGFNLNSITISETGSACTNVNLARCGIAAQSSTNHGGVASRAIDGNTNGVWSVGSVTHTANETNPWWEVTLDNTYEIGDINIFNRTDACCMNRLSNFTVSVLSGSTTTYSQAFTTYPNPSISVNAGGASGDKVRVQLDDTNPLSLAEVEVYEGTTPVNNTLNIQENINGFCLVDGTLDSNNAGFTGTGFANTFNALGNGVNWEVDGAAGSYTFQWRYASASNRPADFLVNGNPVVTNIAFNSTGAWTSWALTSSVSVTLGAGTKTIRLESTTSAGLANIDYLEVVGPNATASFCSSGARYTDQNVSSLSAISSQIEVYPNPTTNLITIETVESGFNRFMIYNIDGKSLLSGNINGDSKALTIDLSAFESGIYILSLTGIQINKQVKVIKH